MTDLPPADWYVDPEDPAQYRYWDGSRWTDHRAPRHSAPHEQAGVSGDGGAFRHRRIGDLLAGTWRLMTQNLRPLLVIYAVVAVVYLAGEETVRRGFDEVFGGTLTALIDEVAALDPDADQEETDALVASRWNDVTDRLEGSGSSTLAAGMLLMALGAVVVIAINIIEFAALGHVAMARLDQRQTGAARALQAGLRRLLRIFGVGLMLLAMLLATLMVVSLVAGLLSLASGALAVGLAVAMGLAVLVLAVGVAPLVLLTLMTAAVGPPEPSMRYARDLLRDAYWATFGRIALITILSVAATVPALLAGELLGRFNDVLGRVALVGIGALPEVLGAIAYFTLYRDLGGEHAEVGGSPAG